MSGPKTVSYRLVSRRETERRLAEERHRRETYLKEMQAATDRCEALEHRRTRLEQALQQLTSKYPAEDVRIKAHFAPRPSAHDPKSLQAYASQLEKQLEGAHASLADAERQAAANNEFRVALKSATTLAGVRESTATAAIDEFLRLRGLGISQKLRSERVAVVERILARLGNEARRVPAACELMAAECVAAESEGRFHALTVELRLAVQREIDAAAVRRADKAEALRLLDDLTESGDEESNELRQTLELVAASAIPLTKDLRDRVEEARNQAAQRSAAEIMTASLGDLGYEVSGIENTLFVKGGVVFFRKPEWGQYCVRLVTRPQDHRMNFNMVRTDPDEAASASDLEIETAWCSEYPKLMATLRSRGLEGSLVRHIEAGAYPVPAVNADEIPADFRATLGSRAKKTRGLVSGTRTPDSSKDRG